MIVAEGFLHPTSLIIVFKSKLCLSDDLLWTCYNMDSRVGKLLHSKLLSFLKLFCVRSYNFSFTKSKLNDVITDHKNNYIKWKLNAIKYNL